MRSDDSGFELLQSEVAVDRLRGARGLLGRATASDLIKLREIRAREVDSWVQVALDRVIRSATAAGPMADDMDRWLSPQNHQLSDDIRAEAIQYVASVMLHELRPLVSSIFRATRDTFGETVFDGSPAHAAIVRLQDFLSTMHRLHDAAAAPNIVQFDLVQLLVEETAAAFYEAGKVVVSRSDILVVLGDPELLRFAVQNCLRNAVEATPLDAAPVVLTCGANQSGSWVAILDEGVGLPESKERLFEPGNSMKSKDEHFGMGLAIAERAMKSFGGSVELTPREFGGTACELRWNVAKVRS